MLKNKFYGFINHFSARFQIIISLNNTAKVILFLKKTSYFFKYLSQKLL